MYPKIDTILQTGSGFPLQVLANFRWSFNWLWAFRCNPSREKT
jgi:hypothetical protein